MRTWHKFFWDKNPKNINLTKKDEKFSDFENAMEGYKVNKYYENKEEFFKKYLNGRYKTFYSFLKKNLSKENIILSLGSGRCITELSLMDNGYNIVCSDLDVPSCYDQSKKIFKDYKYIKFDILNEDISQKFSSIVCFGVIYAFNQNELNNFFKKNSSLLKTGGTLIFDPGGAEDNVFSLFYDKIYLPFENLLISFFLKFFKKKYYLYKKHQGYRSSNKELVKLAREYGFKFIDIEKSDYYEEFNRSKLINFLMKNIPITKVFFGIFGRLFTYIRIFKFEKLDEKNN